MCLYVAITVRSIWPEDQVHLREVFAHRACRQRSMEKKPVLDPSEAPRQAWSLQGMRLLYEHLKVGLRFIDRAGISHSYVKPQQAKACALAYDELPEWKSHGISSPRTQVTKSGASSGVHVI